MKGMTLLGVWAEAGLMLPQADLFRGWLPYSGSFPASGMTAAGECWTAGTSESPSGGGGYSACSLAAILETEADWLIRHPGKTAADWRAYLSGYFLSAKACAGILSRAERRGRKLPPLLDRALRRVAASGRPGDGEWFEDRAFDEGRHAHSRSANGHDAGEDGTGRGTPLVPVAITPVTFRTDQHDTGDGVSVALTLADPVGVVHADPVGPSVFAELGEGHATYQAVGEAAPLRGAAGGGGANANLCVEALAFHLTQDPISGEQSPCLSGGNRHGCGTVGVMAFAENVRGEVRTLDHAPALTGGGGKPGQGYPAVMSCINDADLIVRRLTPTECLRLQAMPDDWLDGLGLSDSAKYHLCGNAGVANCLEWIGRRLAAELRREG